MKQFNGKGYPQNREPEAPSQGLVDENLNNALEGGYFTDLSEWTVDDIVIDLMAFSDDFSAVDDEAILKPFVQVWYDKQKEK